jgi:hypothetical protein
MAFSSLTGGNKDSSRIKGVLRQWKQEKKDEAIVRQEAYNKLTIEQKLVKLDVGDFKAVKQRRKLLEQQMKKVESCDKPVPAKLEKALKHTDSLPDKYFGKSNEVMETMDDPASKQKSFKQTAAEIDGIIRKLKTYMKGAKDGKV